MRESWEGDMLVANVEDLQEITLLKFVKRIQNSVVRATITDKRFASFNCSAPASTEHSHNPTGHQKPHIALFDQRHHMCKTVS